MILKRLFTKFNLYRRGVFVLLTCERPQGVSLHGFLDSVYKEGNYA